MENHHFYWVNVNQLFLLPCSIAFTLVRGSPVTLEWTCQDHQHGVCLAGDRPLGELQKGEQLQKAAS